MKLKGSAIGRRATVYIAFVCVLILGLVGWRSWSVHQDRSQELRFMTGSFARIAAQQAQDAFQVAELALQAVGGVVSRKGISAASLAEIVRLMKMDLTIAPQIQGMLIFDAEGKLLATTYAPTPPAVNSADRPFFIYHRTHTDAGLRINPPIISRTIGGWVLPLTLRLNQPDGRFGGIVAADIDLEFLRQFYERMIPGTNSVVTLFAADGTLLLRWPYRTEYLARSPARAETLRGLVHQTVEGSLIRKSALDGVERFTSFRRLEHYPVFMLVGVGYCQVVPKVGEYNGA